MRIKILTTGGTIDKVYFDAKSNYEVGDPQIVEILKGANVTFEYDVERVFQKDSLDLTPTDRDEIARRVQAETCKNIIVTHGTDTMVDTAKALAPIAGGKTVVLVGSLSPARFKGSDAEFNIGFAFGAVQSLPPGVYIAMNGCIFRPDRVRKNLDLNRFEEVPDGE